MRELHVDFIKGWAMITIVFFHMTTGLKWGVLSEVIGNPWNVPIFFIIAGFFVNEDKLASPYSFIKRKLKTLYLPATIVYILAVLLHNVFVDIGWYPLGNIHPGNDIPFCHYELKDMLIGCGKALLCVGSGELVMGAMWFLYVLIYAFVGLALLTWVIRKKCTNEKSVKKIRLLILIAFASISCYLTQKLCYTINRINVTFTAMLLIEIGKYINQDLKWKYNDMYMFIGCILISLHCIFMHRGTMTLANNEYQDLLILVIGSCSTIYLWGWLFKKIANTSFSRFVCYVGRESLYVMMFHIMGFFLCNSIFECLDIFNTNTPKGMYTYNLMLNPLYIFTYLSFGIGLPLIILFIYKRIQLRFFNLKTK